jgi:hypothetical protein
MAQSLEKEKPAIIGGAARGKGPAEVLYSESRGLTSPPRRGAKHCRGEVWLGCRLLEGAKLSGRFSLLSSRLSGATVKLLTARAFCEKFFAELTRSSFFPDLHPPTLAQRAYTCFLFSPFSLLYFFFFLFVLPTSRLCGMLLLF